MPPETRKSSLRVPPVAPGTRPELAALEARITGSRGRVTPLYQVLLHAPQLASGWEQLFTAIRQQSSVPPALRELVILRIALLNGADYEFEAHVPHALQAGIDPAAIERLRINDLHRFSEVEKTVLRYTDAMTRDISVPDALFTQVRAQLDERGIVELTATIAAYNMVSRFLVALRIA